MYETKKILLALGMEYAKIRTCPNDCILYQKEFMDASKCPVCETSRWKKNLKGEDKKGIPKKVLQHIPPILRFKHLFQNEQHVKSLLWHDEERIKDGKLQHQANFLAWELVDKMWSKIGDDSRNLRLVSSTSINPHSSLSSKYNCWPVILTIYNLPPWLCMKRKFTILTLLISGPN